MKKQNLFVSNCCKSVVVYREIIEDSSPSRTIAVAGRCHACMGIQKVVECAYNIDRIKLVQALHGNNNWLLDSKMVKDLQIKPGEHGELSDVFLPVPKRPAPVVPPDKDFTEPQSCNHEGGGVF